MRHSSRMALASAALLGTVGCAADPEEDGSCKLQCSKPKVASIDYVVEPLTPEGFSQAYFCQGTPGVYAMNRPLMVTYRIYQKFDGLQIGGGGGGGGEDGGEAQALQGGDEDAPGTKIPVGGIAFEPYVSGAMNTDATNEEHLTTNAEGEKVASPARFEGVVTPKSEWCSDTCGVIRFEIAPVCIVPGSNDVTAGVLVQGVKSKEWVSYEITGEAP